jgi:Coenzyme PQQ synthesis protein D (PqqD)
VSDTRFSLRTADLEWREVEGELVALDLRDSRYLAVNPSGQVLWGALAEAEGATRDELIRKLVDFFDIEPDRAAADVDAFTAELESRDLLVRDQSAA